MTKGLVFVFLLFPVSHYTSGLADENKKLELLIADFEKGYAVFDIPEFGYDYRENFSVIPALSLLNRQEIFFPGAQEKLTTIDPNLLSLRNRINLDHLIYECRLNLERVRLEKMFRNSNESIPYNGLYSLSNRKEWYQYYVHFFTGTDITPDELYEF